MTTHTANSKVIVSEFSNSVTAFLVSGVTRIHRLTWDQVEAPDAHMQSYTSNSITGVVRMNESIVFLLDMEQIIISMNPRAGLHISTEAVIPIGHDWKVLIADDSSAIRTAISETLSRSGFRVTPTASGKQAWNTLNDWKKKAVDSGAPISDYVDLVISDIEMPEMDGHNLTLRIKEDSVLKTLPVMLFSSLITDALRHKGASVGADDQISKPDLPSLARRAADIIAERKGLGSA
jgi:two-component system chemotaxis response regulator CheV